MPNACAAVVIITTCGRKGLRNRASAAASCSSENPPSPRTSTDRNQGRAWWKVLPARSRRAGGQRRARAGQQVFGVSSPSNWTFWHLRFHQFSPLLISHLRVRTPRRSSSGAISSSSRRARREKPRLAEAQGRWADAVLTDEAFWPFAGSNCPAPTVRCRNGPDTGAWKG